MWKKKDEGAVKPLWVKCQCGKWNGVAAGNVVKYLDRIFGKADEPKQKSSTGRDLTPTEEDLRS